MDNSKQLFKLINIILMKEIKQRTLPQQSQLVCIQLASCQRAQYHIQQNKIGKNKQLIWVDAKIPYSECTLEQLAQQLATQKQYKIKMDQYKSKLEMKKQREMRINKESQFSTNLQEECDTIQTLIVNNYQYDISHGNDQWFSLVFLPKIETIFPTTNTYYIWINKQNREQSNYFDIYHKYLRLKSMIKVANVNQFLGLFQNIKKDTLQIWVQNLQDFSQLIEQMKKKIISSQISQNSIEIYFISERQNQVNQQLWKINQLEKFNIYFLTRMGELIQKTASKLSQDNFIYLKDQQIKTSQMLRKNLIAVINQKTNQQQLIKNFLKLAKNYIQLQQNCEVETQINKLQSDCEQIITKNFDPKVVLNVYTRENYLYRIMNNILRKPKNYFQIYYIQPFIKAMVNNIEDRQKHKFDPFKCYRGGYLRRQQIKQLLDSAGQLIQTLGFLSTSLNKDVIQQFYFNTLFTINVENTLQECKKCCSYILIKQISEYSYEEQVLFMPLSRFKVQVVNRFQNQTHKNYHKIEVVLKYITKCDCRLKQSTKYVCQGDILEQLQQFKDAHEDYMSKTVTYEYDRLAKDIQQISKQITKRKIQTDNLSLQHKQSIQCRNQIPR